MESEVNKRELVVRSGLRLLEMGLVERTWGNVSSKLGDRYFAITPSGASYTTLLAEDIVVVELHTLRFNSTKKPSSELQLHAKIYNQFPNINFILHTHQSWASLLSLFCANKMSRIELPFQRHNMLGRYLPCAKYAEAGSEEIANNVVDAIISAYPSNCQLGFGIALMASHGVVVFAKTDSEAFSLVENLESIAKNIIKKKLSLALSLGSDSSILDFNIRTKIQLFDITKDTFPICNKALSQFFSCLLNARLLSDDIFYFFAPFFYDNIISYATNICCNQKKLLDTNNPSSFFYKMFVYFDDVAQIGGASFKIINLEKDQVSVENLFLNFEDSNVLILKDYGVLIASSSKEDAFSAISLLEKNSYAFLLSLYDRNIMPLSAHNAKELHASYVKGYSKLKDK